ncbi:hypothetical protein WICPIJ_003260 [Wickerhamomyces pijperi]|uniref:Secreted protein n=1 Tax=Wickerhamomyces pijperi TaxID=599730 RepID=A0A9P8Q9X2_WICPI|nr:hypothetical protein WICPIJ_003260 [Wickerhamomyces pijperi]
MIFPLTAELLWISVIASAIEPREPDLDLSEYEVSESYPLSASEVSLNKEALEIESESEAEAAESTFLRSALLRSCNLFILLVFKSSTCSS